jgi:hypothetical protein
MVRKGIASGIAMAAIACMMMSCGDSGNPVAPIKPAAPVLAAVTVSDASATVTWNAVSGAASYNLYYAIGATVDKTGTKVAGATSPKTVTGLTNGSPYAFAVTAVNSAGESDVSNVMTQTPQVPPDSAVPLPSGTTLVFKEGFGEGLTRWEVSYMINIVDNYPQMTISTAAAHSGTHSITSDASRSALVYNIDPRLEAGTVGLQFYMMATAAGQTNFSVRFGQNAGSSGGLGKAFGFGFDKTDSVKTIYYDSWEMNPEIDSMLAPIQMNHWYKCVVEINFAAGTAGNITWKLDDAVVQTKPLPVSEMYGIDRALVFRGMDGADGVKPYYADDIVVYTK